MVVALVFTWDEEEEEEGYLTSPSRRRTVTVTS
jgi:hypothetical protein